MYASVQPVQDKTNKNNNAPLGWERGLNSTQEMSNPIETYIGPPRPFFVAEEKYPGSISGLWRLYQEAAATLHSCETRETDIIVDFT